MRDAPPFDVDTYLRRPLVARLATAGPTIRPIWYLWEDGAFWWLTGTWSRLPDRLRSDPQVALVVDTCDLATGRVRQVTASGAADLADYDAERARRKLRRYLGGDERRWDRRFAPDQVAGGAMFARLVPDRLVARDLSYTPSTAEA